MSRLCSRRLLYSGRRPWRQTISEQLEAARCVVVVWSEISVGPLGKFVQDEADRAKDRGEAAIAPLDKCWHLKPIEVEHLDDVLARAKGLGRRLQKTAIEPRVFLDAIAALSFAEKYALVDRAVQAHAGRAVAGEGEER